MYNLIVAGNTEFFDHGSFELEMGRCVREYTDEDIIEKVGDWTPSSIRRLKRLPSIFAYESVNEKEPFFGRITEIKKSGRQIRVNFEREDVYPFIKAEQLLEDSRVFDIKKWELNRTHWAVKDVELFDLLFEADIVLPSWARPRKPVIDLETHQFEVALSFPGEVRELVEKIAQGLERELGPNTYFYDHNYKPQLAIPNANHLLQEVYGKRSRLIVVFVSGKYAEKDWCKLEWRSIEQIITENKSKVMLIRTDDGEVPGIMKYDGYVDARIESVETLIEAIQIRSELEIRKAS